MPSLTNWAGLGCSTGAGGSTTRTPSTGTLNRTLSKDTTLAKELDLQTKIWKSAKQDGGYGRKISHKFAIGIPDLLLALPPFAPCLAEIKDMGEVVNKFDKQFDITEKQSEELKRFSEPYEKSMTIYTPNKQSSIVLVGVKHRKDFRLVACHRADIRLNHTYEEDPQRWVSRGVGGYYNLAPLLEWAGIIKVKAM